MKLHVAGLLGIMVAALSTVGCGSARHGSGAQVPVGRATLTSAPMTPDAPLPAAIWEEDDEPFTPPVETWGVRPTRPEELEKYGF